MEKEKQGIAQLSGGRLRTANPRSVRIKEKRAIRKKVVKSWEGKGARESAR